MRIGIDMEMEKVLLDSVSYSTSESVEKKLKELDGVEFLMTIPIGEDYGEE